jgi:integrase
MASIKPITTDGGERRYRVRYRDPSARSREKWFGRKVDAERFARTVEVDKDRGEYIDTRRGRITLEEWSQKWLATKADKKPKTLEGYQSLLDNHVLPALGERSLRSITSEDIGMWLGRLKGSGLSASRVRQSFSVFSDVLRTAVAFERLVRNPADAVRKQVPTPQEAEMLFLDHEQIRRLAEAVGDPYGVLVLTLGYSGIRWGEAAALRQRRIKVLGARMHVAESVTEVAGRLVYGTPKSGRDRWVAIPRFLAEALGHHLVGVRADPDAFVFATPDGSPLRNSNFRTRIWKRAITDAGLPTELRIHDLRHSAASLMIDAGAPLTLVQRQLGHSSVTVTQRYAHLYPSQADELAQRLDERHRTAGEAEGVGLAWGSLAPMPR